MPLISNSHLQTILDKLARYAGEAVGDTEFDAGFTAGLEAAAANVLSGSNSIETFVAAMANPEAMADLLPAARDLDEDHPTLSDGYLLTLKGISPIITALNTHVKRYALAASLDAYLTTLNATTPTLRAHANFKKYLKTITAGNTFIPVDMDIASLAITGATSGTYAHLGSILSSQYAGAKLVVKNTTTLTGTTGVTVTAKKKDGSTQSLTASVSTLTNGFETNLSVTDKLFYDVTAIAVTGGTSGNSIKIVAKTDRDITSA